MIDLRSPAADHCHGPNCPGANKTYFADGTPWLVCVCFCWRCRKTRQARMHIGGNR